MEGDVEITEVTFPKPIEISKEDPKEEKNNLQKEK